MGNRRLGRSRLYTIEKAGKDIDLGAGEGASPMIARTTQSRLGNELITEIVLDLGTSKGAIIDGTVSRPIGVTGKPAQLGELTVAKVGVVTEIRAVVLEAISGGQADLDIDYGTAAVNTNAAITGVANVMEELTTVGEDTSKAYDNNVVAGKYLYLTTGNGSGDGSTYTGGKIVIYIYGYVVPDDL